MRFLLALLCLSSPLFAQGANEAVFKQIAAPPSDILSGRVRLPDPADLATTSRAWMAPLAFERGADGTWSWRHQVAVAQDGGVALALMTTESGRWTIEVAGRDGALTPLEGAFGAGAIEHSSQSLADEKPGWRVDRYDVAAGRVASELELVVRSPDPTAPEGWIVVRDTAPWSLSAHVTTLATTSDREIGIVAHVFDPAVAPALRAAPGVVESCRVDASIQGTVHRLPMFDDGAHGDGAALDGVFGAFLPRWTTGNVEARVEAVGASGGVRFERTVQLLVPIVERRTALTGGVDTRVDDSLHVRIELGALAFTDPAQLHVSAELWGVDEHGEFVPVCWMSRMLVPETRDGGWRLPLAFDVRWIGVTRTVAPFVLRNVRVQDPDTHAVHDGADWLPLPTLTLPPVVGPGTTVVTSAMLAFPPSPSPGSGGVEFVPAPKPFGRRLLLVHGYCSGGSIWPAADFTTPKQEFLDPNQNRTHDQFAQLLRQSVTPRSSFGVVGHSQGGPAALQLFTYYWSGLDNAVGPRLIQSVASPYQGTPLASWGGFACGVNNDMTPSGSTTWLAGIPTWARAKVWYWTTSNSGSACNLITDLLLTNPEDGTTEQFRGQLPGANAMGHVTGWCHTTGMSNPANYTDHARNALMNTNAAR